VYPTYHHSDKLEGSDSDFKCDILKEDEVICIGRGPTKKKAEQNASYNALIKFNVLT
jgi:dsRNA-specific ribonuclease